MRLTTMAESLEQRLQRKDHHDLSTEEFVGLLVDDEYTAKQNRKLNRMINRADFKPEQACLENIKYHPTRGFGKKDIMQLTMQTWINNSQNLILVGATGTGKTYLAEAVGLHACKMGFPAKKIRYKKLFEEIKTNRGTGLYLDYIQKIEKFKILILDDFLMSPVEPQELNDLLDIIEDRTMRAPIIITTQYPIKKWHTILQEPTIADAICDRLIHGAITLNLEGPSMRKLTRKN
ncbi:IS21-like element helper ATPase IstB [Patescibacteria group bacterium]|nr:IS21-like element helper ATPase IstB [Patescibacteria group bacterium]MBU2260177.1 IS21-like element helper ATPase IstB [Patescibacteria group bacterium]